MRVLTDAELFAPVTRIARSMDELEQLLRAATREAATSGSINPYGILDLCDAPPGETRRLERPPLA